MADTYCGKSCAECSKRNELNCPGCKAGPGRQFNTQCDLARCVREKGHETCETCAYKGNCGTLRSRDFQTEYRKRALDAENSRRASLLARIPILGKWLWILFWLVIPANLAAIMTMDVVVDVLPGLMIPGELLSLATTIAYGLILMKLRDQDDQYRISGICNLVSAAVGFLLNMFTDGSGWTLLVSLPAAIVSMVGVYNEYMAHSAVLSGVDNDLSEKWEKLWKWEIGLLGATFGGVFVAIILPLIGILLTLGGAIGIIVASILKLIYLYRTAKCFREYEFA